MTMGDRLSESDVQGLRCHSETAHCWQKLVSKDAEHGRSHSVDHLLQLLHRQGAHSLGSRLGLEDARLLGEGIYALASCLRWLLLELHVQGACQLELASLLQLSRSHFNDAH